MELLPTLRKIRACESEVTAQLLLEAYVAQEVAIEVARVAEAQARRQQTRQPPDFLDALKYGLAARGG